MLEFEDEMKAVKKGYVVLSLDEYNDMRDALAEANVRAYEAEQLANRRIAEETTRATRELDSLFTVDRREFVDGAIVVRFNKSALHEHATRLMHARYSDQELSSYTVNEPSKLAVYDVVLAATNNDIE